jgi:hypothetical protein
VVDRDDLKPEGLNPVSMRRIHAATSRNATRALDAAHPGSIEGYEPSFETKGPRLPSELESPM